MKQYILAAIGFIIVGCAHVGDEFRPPTQEPCEIRIYVDGHYHSCISRERWKREVDRAETQG